MKPGRIRREFRMVSDVLCEKAFKDGLHVPAPQNTCREINKQTACVNEHYDDVWVAVTEKSNILGKKVTVQREKTKGSKPLLCITGTNTGAIDMHKQ